VKLPNGDRAYIGDKLERYVFNAEHGVGKHKARVFAAALGITRANVQILVQALLEQAASSDSARLVGENAVGDLFELEFQFRTSDRSAWVRSAWIVRYEEGFPRLVTCLIVNKRV
jgi:hypothetical protein